MSSIDPPAAAEIRLLLIGPPKVGQSSIANVLAGRNVFPIAASSSSSKTATKSPRHYTNKTILSNKHLLIVDAPPLFVLKNSTSNEAEMKSLAECIAYISPGPHAIFLILSCDDKKNDLFDMEKIVTTVFGSEALKQSIVVFTNIDRLTEKNISVEDFINNQCKQQSLLDACDRRYLTIDSSTNDLTKHETFIKQALILLNNLWEKQTIFKSDMFNTIEKELQHIEQHRLQDLLKPDTSIVEQGAMKLAVREQLRDDIHSHRELADSTFFTLQTHLQTIFKSLVQEVARYFEENIASS
ncbi:unnamed protein product [Didymodactylos carnosus]|uniref:AIG1-type G domain-containing protein n=1 Tax=Didymodactylos carnosus TaxID=1234261 RepID=A0A814A562_9BILA|nr:unnamed protein product [Didymodactylos carnosus]CAF1216849.1 unnamed protein product [Didymodactylos carnosus]CAF3689017.1 unnamed protein product [Didymodactylos carnosus]CAF4025250.1 unnamed protein product [Didymodactylos carnosus]